MEKIPMKNRNRLLAHKRRMQTKQKIAMSHPKRRLRYQPDLSQVSTHISSLIIADYNFFVCGGVELDRLTTVVHAIENDCQICPIGSFKMTPEHQVRRNEAFRGLTREDGMKLDSYLHFRNVQDAEKHR